MAVGNHRVADIAVGNRAVVAADTSVVEVVVAAAPVVGSPYSRSSLAINDCILGSIRPVGESSFRLVTEYGTIYHRSVIHLTDTIQATIDVFDRFDLRTDTLQLDLIDGIQSGYITVQLFHLVYVTTGVLVDAIGIIRDTLIRVQQCIGYVRKRISHLAETLHVLRHAR